MMNLKKCIKKYRGFFLSQFLMCQFFYSKVLVDNTDSKKRVQIVVKFSMEIDRKKSLIKTLKTPSVASLRRLSCNKFEIKKHKIR